MTARTTSTDIGLDPVLKIHGKLKPGGIAKGTVQLKGHLDGSNPTALCDTGELSWKATRASPRLRGCPWPAPALRGLF